MCYRLPIVRNLSAALRREYREKDDEPVVEMIGHIRMGVSKGLRGYLWLLKILVPVSFLTWLLQYSGWLNAADVILTPVMGWLSLPPEAALPLIVGLLTGIYGAIAAMSVLPLSGNEMTLIAVFLLISHALPQEGIIQGKSGMPPLTATLIRLAASVVTVLCVAPLLGLWPVHHAGGVPVAAAHVQPFADALLGWFRGMALLSVKILGIITALMVALELLKAYHVIDWMLIRIEPLFRVQGLPRQVGMLWLAAALFGISYGAAVIVEETRNGEYTPDELKQLHISIGINHAMVEDPALFLSLGIPAVWLWGPRLAAAILAVHMATLVSRLLAPARKAAGPRPQIP